MTYAAAAILIAFALACLLWPGRVLRIAQGNALDLFSPAYARASAIVLRLIGLALLIAVPALYWLGYAR